MTSNCLSKKIKKKKKKKKKNTQTKMRERFLLARVDKQHNKFFLLNFNFTIITFSSTQMGLASSSENESDIERTSTASPLTITEELSRKIVTLGWDCPEPVSITSISECINRFQEWKGDRKIEWNCCEMIVVDETGEVIEFDDLPIEISKKIFSTEDDQQIPSIAVVTIAAAISLKSKDFHNCDDHQEASPDASISCVPITEIQLEDSSDLGSSSKDKAQDSTLSRCSSTLSSSETVVTTDADYGTGLLPPSISKVEPPFGQIGSSVIIHGSLFGGCSITDLKVLCGLHNDSIPKLSRQPVVATDVERLSSKMIRVRIPQGVRCSFPIIVTSPFGRSPRNNLPHYKVCLHDEVVMPLTIKVASIHDNELRLHGNNLDPPLNISIIGRAIPHCDVAFISDTDISIQLSGIVTLKDISESSTGAPIVIHNNETSCCYIYNAKKVYLNMKGRSGSYIPESLKKLNYIESCSDREEEEYATQSKQYWIIAPDSVSWHGITMKSVIRVMYKLRCLEKLKVSDSTFKHPIPEKLLLTLPDYRSICKSQELHEQYFFYRTQSSSIATAPLFKSLCQALWKQAEDFKLMDVAVQGYTDGDVLFYDLQNRAALGDIDLRDRWSSAFYRLQKGYDRYSHSGIFVRRSGKASRPAIFHGLRTRVKDLVVPAAFSYMPKREIDLGKVFFRFQFLPEDMQEKMYFWYREGIVSRSRQGQLILNDCADLWDIVTVVNSVPTERRKSLTQVGEQQHQRRGSVSKVMCSAFTASVLLETFLEIQNRLYAVADQEFESSLSILYKSIHVHPSFLVDTLAVAPKLLHQWNIWRDQLQDSPGLLQISASDVRTSFETLQSLQYSRDVD